MGKSTRRKGSSINRKSSFHGMAVTVVVMSLVGVLVWSSIRVSNGGSGVQPNEAPRPNAHQLERRNAAMSFAASRKHVELVDRIGKAMQADKENDKSGSWRDEDANQERSNDSEDEPRDGRSSLDTRVDSDSESEGGQDDSRLDVDKPQKQRKKLRLNNRNGMKPQSGGHVPVKMSKLRGGAHRGEDTRVVRGGRGYDPVADGGNLDGVKIPKYPEEGMTQKKRNKNKGKNKKKKKLPPFHVPRGEALPLITKPTIVDVAEGCEATSDVRGNLGPASVVTSHVTKDWLKDRWQAAKDMSGTPIRGVHWVEVKLRAPTTVVGAVIDFETAYARDYTIQVRQPDEDKWVIVAKAAELLRGHSTMEGKISVQNSHQHVTHSIRFPPAVDVTRVRIHILQPATRWGTSIWQFQVLGETLSDENPEEVD